MKSKVVNKTGVLRDVMLCQIEKTDIQFLFGYIVKHNNTRYRADDWFASSYVVEIRNHDKYCLVSTANSIYQVADYEIISVPLAAVENIRMGTPPRTAVAIVAGYFGKPIH